MVVTAHDPLTQAGGLYCGVIAINDSTRKVVTVVSYTAQSHGPLEWPGGNPIATIGLSTNAAFTYQ